MVAVGAARLGSSSVPARTKDKRRPLFRLAEHIRPASGAETPVHGRAAVGFAYVIGERTGNGDVLLAEKGADRLRFPRRDIGRRGTSNIARRAALSALISYRTAPHRHPPAIAKGQLPLNRLE